MSIEILWGSGSPYSWRVLLAAEIKGVPYTGRLLQFSKSEHKTAEVLALNPRGRVPILRDGDVAVYESLAILDYLEQKFPNPPLFGRNLAQRSRIWTTIFEIDNYLNIPGAPIVAGMYRREKDLSAYAKDLEKVHSELHGYERRLGDSMWLTGDQISAADVVLFPLLMTFRRASVRAPEAARELGVEPMAQKLPNLATWIAQIEALPGYDRTYPPHWRES